LAASCSATAANTDSSTIAGTAIGKRSWQRPAFSTGHSTPLLAARYSHRRLYDLAGAVDKLPKLVPSNDAAAIPLRFTGTDGPNAAAEPFKARWV
jgi:hypothetical protein